MEGKCTCVVKKDILKCRGNWYRSRVKKIKLKRLKQKGTEAMGKNVKLCKFTRLDDV